MWTSQQTSGQAEQNEIKHTITFHSVHAASIRDQIQQFSCSFIHLWFFSSYFYFVVTSVNFTFNGSKMHSWIWDYSIFNTCIYSVVYILDLDLFLLCSTKTLWEKIKFCWLIDEKNHPVLSVYALYQNVIYLVGHLSVIPVLAAYYLYILWDCLHFIHIAIVCTVQEDYVMNIMRWYDC